MPLVVDASALVFATTELTPAARRARERLRDEECHAPHLVDAEFGNVLRRKTARNEVRPEAAGTLLDVAWELVDHRHDHRGDLAAVAWSLRANLTFYDALYVALADALDIPLLTLDGRLARTPGLPCEFEVLGP